MEDDEIPSDFRVQIGRPAAVETPDRGRTLVRVVHVPTGKERFLLGTGKADPYDVAHFSSSMNLGRSWKRGRGVGVRIP